MMSLWLMSCSLATIRYSLASVRTELLTMRNGAKDPIPEVEEFWGLSECLLDRTHELRSVYYIFKGAHTKLSLGPGLPGPADEAHKKRLERYNDQMSEVELECMELARKVHELSARAASAAAKAAGMPEAAFVSPAEGVAEMATSPYTTAEPVRIAHRSSERVRPVNATSPQNVAKAANNVSRPPPGGASSANPPSYQSVAAPLVRRYQYHEATSYANPLAQERTNGHQGRRRPRTTESVPNVANLRSVSVDTRHPRTILSSGGRIISFGPRGNITSVPFDRGVHRDARTFTDVRGNVFKIPDGHPLGTFSDAVDNLVHIYEGRILNTGDQRVVMTIADR
ncbi:hypothetical protein BU15DRAFT_64057 [Melanogaster broomeanus]|nr:hypothetical protein BU15DRAFT_64057 [Melanogaster broomeanus]